MKDLWKAAKDLRTTLTIKEAARWGADSMKDLWNAAKNLHTTLTSNGLHVGGLIA